MPLGDSITGSPGCWRALLWNELQNTGYTNIDFVGTLGPQGCGIPYDGDNEGHGGFWVTNVANQNLLPGWLSATNPDVVLMHFGTNDVWNSRPPSEIIGAYDTLVDQMRANNPAMAVLVAQIIPMSPSNCGECGQRVQALNAAIPAWAAGKSTSQSPVLVVDQWSGFQTATDTYDGVHPSAAGDQKIANRWYQTLTGVLDGTPPATTSPPPVTTSPPPVTTSAPVPTTGPGFGCVAAYRVVGQWPGGFQGEVTVTNDGMAPITSWTVQLNFTGGQQVTQHWSAQLDQSGALVTATNAAWNGNLAPQASATFGFLATVPGGNPEPASTCVAS